MEISYGQHPLQKIKLFKHNPQNDRTIIFIHGGAWRDPNNTYMDFASLAHQLDNLPDTNLVGINYRLSPEFKHPCHLIDVVCAIDKIESLGHTKLSFVGHSVGATLLLQLLNYRDIIDTCVDKPNAEVPELQLDISSMVFVDGIFDIVDLIDEYGAPYKLFVDCAFSNQESIENGSQMTWELRKKPFSYVFNATVVQSNEDELLSERQSSRFVDFLRAKGTLCEYLTGPWGKHEEVYKREELATIIRERQ